MRIESIPYRWPVYILLLALLSACGKVQFAAPSDTQKSSQCVGADCTAAVPFKESISIKSTNKVDILFIVDTSGSMNKERQELGNRLATFTSKLGNLDWQICVTTTDPYKEGGRLLNFTVQQADGGGSLQTEVLTPSMQNYNQAFLNRVVNAGSGTGDEQGIHSMNLAIGRKPSCFRDDAALAAIVLSDEDERSAGGQPQYAGSDQFEELEEINLPVKLVDKVKLTFGNQKIFTAHSLVIQSGDQACWSAQKIEGNQAFFGTRYEELSQLTGGIVGNICAADYTSELENFATGIKQSLDSVTLRCAPVQDPKVVISPAQPGTITKVRGNKIVFSPSLPAGTRVDVEYYCPADKITN